MRMRQRIYGNRQGIIWKNYAESGKDSAASASTHNGAFASDGKMKPPMTYR